MPTVPDLVAAAGERPITMLTAYDALTAEIADEGDVDSVLVGDSMGNAVLGYDTTLPVSMEEMYHHTAAVARGAEEALVVADLPFLSVGVSRAETVRNAGKLVKEAGADAVKLESGPHTVEVTDHLVDVGIPVVAHLGLTPQRINQLGGYTRQGTTQDAAREMLELARAHEEAGAFALVLEHVPANVAAQITEALSIPTIGIGAGPDTDGQVLVITDVIGLTEWSPSFARQFGDVRAEMERAVAGYRDAVESGEFPAEEHTHRDASLDDL